MVQDKGIAPHVPVWDRSERKDGTLSSSEFVWDEQANEYRCPQGHALLSDRRQFTKPRDRITKAGTILYSASQHDCTGCPTKQQCCPNMPNRRIMRSVHERSREVARELADTPQYKQSRRDRKKVEMLFAHLKRILKLDRLRLRGLTGAHDEFLLAATAQNLRRMARRLFEGQQSTVAMPAYGGQRILATAAIGDVPLVTRSSPAKRCPGTRSRTEFFNGIDPLLSFDSL
jgi:hypothetical protein